MTNGESTVISLDDIREFERSGPRYTSYPTVVSWNDSLTDDEWRNALSKLGEEKREWSLYLHLPFCEKLCHFCACHKMIDPKREHSSRYLEALQSEMAMAAPYLKNAQLIQLAWGGGTPTFYSPDELETLFRALEAAFPFTANAELSIEANPTVTTVDHLSRLRHLGFNRLSFGVQDFDADVQDLINRHQTVEQTEVLVNEARRLGFQSLNLDLVYGLPRQTLATIESTIDRVIQLRPDRIALYSYAKVPWKYPFQRRFSDADLPEGIEKLELYRLARVKLEASGYRAIGMDHFALPHDELFLARERGELHRNFMGYTTHPHASLVGMGLSSISMLEDIYAQNFHKLPSYYEQLRQRRFAIERAKRLSRDDLMRRFVILEIMCHFRLNYLDFEQKFQESFFHIFDRELLRLRDLEKKSLLIVGDQELLITARGQLFVRNIAMVFDAYLAELPAEGLFSKTL